MLSWVPRIFTVTLLAVVLGVPALSATPDDFDFGERYFESVGSVDDIPYGLVTAMVQDARGLIWLGTQNGLLRFDGYRFRRFTHDPSDAASLSGNFVHALAVAADGRVWVGTGVDGVSVLDPDTERFTRHLHDPARTDGIGPGAIHALAADDLGGMWVAAEVGLVRFDPALHRFEHVGLGPDEGEPARRRRVRSLLAEGGGNVWIGTQDGLWRLSPGAAAQRVGGDALVDREVTALFRARDGQLWIGTRENGAARLDPRDGSLVWIGAGHAQAAELGQSWVNAIAQPSGDEIWLSRFATGIVVADASTGGVRHLLVSDPGLPSSLSFDTVGALLVDRSGLLWVGTWGGGLQRHNPRNVAIRSLRHSQTRPRRLTAPSVLRLLELRDGRVLAGSTGSGIDVIDRRVGVVDRFAPDPARPGALADGTISGLAQDRAGVVWVGTYQAGVHRQDPGRRHFERYGRAHGLPTMQVETLYVGADDTLWVGTGDGLVRLPRGDGRFRGVAGADGQPLRTRVNALAEDQQGRLWVATLDGLHVLEPGAERLRALRHVPGDPASLGSNDVSSLLVDRRGRVWVSTAKGLDRYVTEPSGREWFEHVSASLGHTGDFGGTLLEDARGRLWTPAYVFDPDAGTLYALHRADGFDIGTQWNGSAARTRDGRLLFGGTTGIAIVDPERFEPWRQPPELMITAVTVDDRPRLPGVVDGTVVLAPGERRFGVEFGILDFSAPQSNRYEYRLLGDSPDWIQVDAQHRQAVFGNLWPGTYTFELRATNRVGDRSPEPVRVRVVVLPQAWQSPWFAVAMGALVVLGVAGLLRLAVAGARRRAAVLQALVDERTAELRAAYARAELASITDPLSGLGNRRSLVSTMPALLGSVLHRRRQGDAGSRLAVIVVDIDQFKSTNDQHGHHAGDQVIEGIGHLIRQQLRAGDLAVRWGGEEFLVVLHVGSEEEAWQAAERLRRTVALCPSHAGGASGPQTVSVGVACVPFAAGDPGGLGWEQVVEIADAAMYAAKREGRNRAYGYRGTGALPDGFLGRLREEPMALPLELVRITAPADASASRGAEGH